MYCTRVKIKSFVQRKQELGNMQNGWHFWGWVRAVKYSIQSAANRLQPSHVLKDLLEAKLSQCAEHVQAYFIVAAYNKQRTA